MADEVRMIDANSLCAKIVQSIHDAEEWINEAKEQQDTHGLRCATEAKTSLLAMLDRIHDEPTIEAQPVKHGRWIITDDVEHFIAICSECGRSEDSRGIKDMPYCHCGAKMDVIYQDDKIKAVKVVGWEDDSDEN